MSSIFRDHLFAGKVAFLTGATSGIGLTIAERFAALGARIALMSRKQEKVDAAVAGVLAQGGSAFGFAGDVRNYADVDAALTQTRAQAGEIDFLFCIAAGNFPAPALGMSANGFKSVIDIDLLGTFNTCRAAYAHLRKPGASIISISANHAHQPYAFQAHVCAAKAGVDLLTRTIALEWGREGIRANIIYPGLDRGELVEWVERFYGEYYFRPKAAWRVVRKALFDAGDRKRLYKEAREYLALRSKRKKFVADERAKQTAAPPVPTSAGD